MDDTVPHHVEVDNPYTVYALIDPRDSTVHYIGITISVFARFKQHLLRDGSNIRKDAWITELEQAQLVPIMDSIEHVTSLAEATLREMHWIQHYQECGIELFNIANASLPKRRKSKTSTPKQQKKPSVKLQEESVLTTRDAAKYIQVNHRFIEKLVKSGDLPATRFGKIIRILKRDLDDFMWRHRYA